MTTLFLALVLAILTSCAQPPDAQPFNWQEASWDEIVAQARGTEVSFHMWGGSQAINQWIDQRVAPGLLEEYGLRIRRVPSEAPVFVNRLMTEKAAGRLEGSIDLMWINGENFRRAREADILAGPVTGVLPNFANYVDPATAEFDFGFPTQGYEAPYGRAQFVFEYDSAIAEPPRSFQGLRRWVQENPGRFTYPEPQDFTGNAFIRQAFLALTGGPDQYLAGWNEQLYEEKSPLLWDYLRDLEPYLWQEGRSYPRDLAFLDTLFESQEVWINMSYTQAQAQARILQGRYPTTVRSFLMAEGSLYNTHFTALAFNSPNPPGALVLMNYLLEPSIQRDKNDPVHWGDFTVLDLQRLSAEDRRSFESLDLGQATLPLPALEAGAVPEIPSPYLEALQRDWYTEILGQ